MIPLDQPIRRKGIILAGGKGTRLYPLTLTVCKQMLPVYDKPMIYYPLTTLMLAGIRDILLISTPETVPQMEALLGTGEQWGVRLSYAVQPSPDGIAQALLIGEDFIGGDPLALILGDNMFYGEGLPRTLQTIAATEGRATVFGYPVRDPSQFGTAVLDKDGRLVDIEEKPLEPKTNLAIPGLYFYDADVVGVAREVKPDHRGELQITDVNKELLRRGRLDFEILSRGWAWLDSGTHDGLLDAGNFAKVMESRTGLKLACPEEVAYRMNFITRDALAEQAERLKSSEYGAYLASLLRWEIR